ncbi:MAG: hypothetical protein WAK33_13950, partial [Silvibacterium sp.]
RHTVTTSIVETCNAAGKPNSCWTPNPAPCIHHAQTKRSSKNLSLRHSLAAIGLTGGAGITDKTFLIAKPMRKVAWTRRFAAGWGERGAANGCGEPVQSG